ncbi:MLO-like protein 2 [Cucumis melo]|uniref:MLO-like protein 2 n=1 Tax=Cucumis melo TaxID=3656 RepID=A0ABM3KBK9_CUCME|nr:MLO-like protein 2 [Cucumis melo]
MGIGVQLLCGYVTLPLYALVTQMGTRPKRTVFTDGIVEGLKKWQKRSKQSLSKKAFTSKSTYYFHSQGDGHYEMKDKEANKSKHGGCKNGGCNEAIIVGSSSTSRRNPQNENPSEGMKPNYDGEISFASTWKQIEIN